ncbi:transmembrane amino acid transporter protein-domain-containing protein [Phlyctochytrium arcticum]|nr:transmembrane amino acid transporter protein-domain-containing protein [Phlyctochytrium arcticum]
MGPTSARRSLDTTPLESPTLPEDAWDDSEFPNLSEEHELLGLDDFERDDSGMMADLQAEMERKRGHGPEGSVLSGVLDATFNFTNSIIGAGIIGLPYAFHQAGFITGTFLLILLTYVVDWTVRLLIIDSKLSGKSTYQDLVWHCFGNRGYIAISIFQFIFAYGAMCAYAVIVGDTIPIVFSQLVSPSSFLYPIITSRRLIIVLCTIFISLPLSMYKDISALAKTSAVSLAAILYIIGVVIAAGPALPAEEKGTDRWLTFVDTGVFQAIGVISFAFVCHHNTFLIFGSLRKPTINRFAIVTHLSTGMSLVACGLLGMGGYIVFTEKTHGNILNNFPNSHTLINTARLAFGANMFLTFPLECFVCREVILNSLYTHPSNPTTGHSHPSDFAHIVTTLVLTLSAMVIALLTCDLGFVLEITGGFAATVLAFILPAACYLKLTDGPWWDPKRRGKWASIVFGLIVMVLSTGMAIAELLSGKENHKSCGW